MRNHVVITGTGRAGTTALVALLGRLGHDIDGATKIDQQARAGPEADIFKDGAPYIVKSPWLAWKMKQVIDNPDISIDAVLVPIRDLYDSAASRATAESKWSWRRALGKHSQGGRISGGDINNEVFTLARMTHQLMHDLAELPESRPIVLMQYPRFINDADYCRRRLDRAWLVRCSREEFAKAHAEIMDPDMVGIYG